VVVVEVVGEPLMERQEMVLLVVLVVVAVFH
jgi:hypothetical protein